MTAHRTKPKAEPDMGQAAADYLATLELEVATLARELLKTNDPVKAREIATRLLECLER